MKENKRKKQAERQEKLKARLAHKGFKDATQPLLGELPIDYEISDRTRVLCVGGYRCDAYLGDVVVFA